MTFIPLSCTVIIVFYLSLAYLLDCEGNSIVAGWGRLSESGSLPHVMQYVTLPLISTRRCHDLYTKAGYTKFIHSCQLCSGYESGGLDSCQVSR